MQILTELDIQDWLNPITTKLQTLAIDDLEHGNILYMPKLPFILTEMEAPILTTEVSNQKSKNISFNSQLDTLHGVNSNDYDPGLIKSMMARFSNYAQTLMHQLLPSYRKAIQMGRTSYRPVEIHGRTPKSYRKDDTRLHIDAFPSSPNQGRRILRVFTNINPNGQSRVWRYGEAFESVVHRFLPKIGKPWPGRSLLLKKLGITKTYSTEYDYIMLNMHHKMKADMHYQRTAVQGEIHFVPGNTWIVQTDHVSHAALSGQFLLEQTFYLPVEAMKHPERSPLRVLETAKGRNLR